TGGPGKCGERGLGGERRDKKGVKENRPGKTSRDCVAHRYVPPRRFSSTHFLDAFRSTDSEDVQPRPQTSGERRRRRAPKQDGVGGLARALEGPVIHARAGAKPAAAVDRAAGAGAGHERIERVLGAKTPRRVRELGRGGEPRQVGYPIGERPARDRGVPGVPGLRGDVRRAAEGRLVELPGEGVAVLVYEIPHEQPARPNLRQGALVELDQQRRVAGGAEVLVRIVVVVAHVAEERRGD